MLFYKKSTFLISLGDKKIKTNCLMTVFGICKYSGGGMQFTKNVNPKNGVLDVTIVSNFSFLDLVLNLPKLYNGKIVNHQKVQTFTTKKIIVTPKNNNVFFQADGEILGKGTIEVSIIPQTVCFIIS